MQIKPYSLKRRLFVPLLGTISIVWIAAAVYSYWDARHEVSELLDAHLAQSASMIVAQVGAGLEDIEFENAPALHERSRRVVFQIWEGNRLQLQSKNAPEMRLSDRDEGFSNAVIAGRSWRVFSGRDLSRRYLVQVAERDETRREIAASVAGNLLLPMLVALPAIGIFIWISISGALRSLERLRDELRQRKPDQLGEVAAEGAPAEVVPLVESLNELFGRVNRMIESERRFTADAAHEMRTPLAALKTQAQVALGAADDSSRRHALEQVLAGCDRTARLVEQLLTLSRLEPAQLDAPPLSCDLHLLARQAVADIAPAALARGVDVDLEDGPPVPLHAYPELVAILMRNLLDNALRYGAEGKLIRVKTLCDSRGATVVVADRGPGIPAAERAKVGQRFYRILGTGQTGSGLGLSIVNRIAEVHGASVELGEGDDGRGLAVRVAFPGNG